MGIGTEEIIGVFRLRVSCHGVVGAHSNLVEAADVYLLRVCVVSHGPVSRTHAGGISYFDAVVPTPPPPTPPRPPPSASSPRLPASIVWATPFHRKA